MSKNKIKNIILIVILSLLVYEIGGWIADSFNFLAGLAVSVFVTAVSVYCSRKAKAGAKNVVWFLVPTFLFVVIPSLFRVWDFMTGDSNLTQWLLNQLWFVFGFVMPIALLVYLYVSLRKEAKGTTEDETEDTTEII